MGWPGALNEGLDGGVQATTPQSPARTASAPDAPGLALSLWMIDEAAGEIQGHPEAPISLKKRLSYWRTALRDVAALESVEQDGAALVKLFEDLAPRAMNLFMASFIWCRMEALNRHASRSEDGNTDATRRAFR